MINIDYLIEHLGIKESVHPKCVWNITSGDDHSEECDNSNILEAAIFNSQVTVPICPSHLRGHILVTNLANHGHDIEEILAMTLADREQKFVGLYSSGTVDRTFCLKLTGLPDSTSDGDLAKAAAKELQM